MKGLLIDNQTGDLMLSGADKKTLALGNVAEQIIEHVLLAFRGEFKETPLLGAEIKMQMGANRDPLWAAQAKKMISAAGVQIKRIKISENEINIE